MILHAPGSACKWKRSNLVELYHRPLAEVSDLHSCNDRPRALSPLESAKMAPRWRARICKRSYHASWIQNFHFRSSLGPGPSTGNFAKNSTIFDRSWTYAEFNQIQPYSIVSISTFNQIYQHDRIRNNSPQNSTKIRIRPEAYNSSVAPSCTVSTVPSGHVVVPSVR